MTRTLEDSREALKLQTTVLLAIDPGTHSGLALFKGGVLRYAESVDSDSPTDIVSKGHAIRRALGFISNIQPGYTLLYVSERQFLKVHGTSRFKSVAQIIRSAACWETLIRVQGWTVLEPSWPATWQAFWNISGKSAQRKQQSRKVVQLMYPKPRPICGKLTDNISDAILIGLHSLATRPNTPKPVIDLATEHGRYQSNV